MWKSISSAMVQASVFDDERGKVFEWSLDAQFMTCTKSSQAEQSAELRGRIFQA